jgi:hypothetical protein
MFFDYFGKRLWSEEIWYFGEATANIGLIFAGTLAFAILLDRFHIRVGFMSSSTETVGKSERWSTTPLLPYCYTY